MVQAPHSKEGKQLIMDIDQSEAVKCPGCRRTLIAGYCKGCDIDFGDPRKVTRK